MRCTRALLALVSGWVAPLMGMHMWAYQLGINNNNNNNWAYHMRRTHAAPALPACMETAHPSSHVTETVLLLLCLHGNRPSIQSCDRDSNPSQGGRWGTPSGLTVTSPPRGGLSR